MYCMHCGTKNPDGARYCNNCGAAMNGSSSGKVSSGKKKSGTDWGYFFAMVVLLGVAIFLVNTVIDGIGFLFSGKGSAVKQDTKTDSGSSQVELYNPTPAPEAAPESGYIPNLVGNWEEVKLKDGNFNLNVSALAFSETIYNCTEFTVMMDVTMNAGTSCKDWQVWGRSGGSFVKIGKVYLPNGDGYISQPLYFSTPVTFDAIAITPTVVGGYSWSMGLSIVDVFTK